MRATVAYDVELIELDMARKGWLPIDLARESSLSQMTIGRFLKKERQTARTAKRIAFALGHKVDRYLKSRRGSGAAA